MNDNLQKKILEIIRNEMSSEERKQNDLNLETSANSSNQRKRVNSK